MLLSRSTSNSKYVIAKYVLFIQPEFTSNTSPHFTSLYPDDPPSTPPYLSLYL
jgi:hypothetical protein